MSACRRHRNEISKSISIFRGITNIKKTTGDVIRLNVKWEVQDCHLQNRKVPISQRVGKIRTTLKRLYIYTINVQLLNGTIKKVYGSGKPTILASKLKHLYFSLYRRDRKWNSNGYIYVFKVQLLIGLSQILHHLIGSGKSNRNINDKTF